MKRIKILYTIGTLDVGGTEQQLVKLVGRLNRERFEPAVCSLTPGGALAPVLKQMGVAVHVISFKGFRTGGMGLVTGLPGVLRTLFEFWRLLRAERPDIVHGMLFFAYVVATISARAARVPIVVSSRRSLGLFKADKPHYLLLERIINRMTDLILANSEAVRQDAIHQEGLRPADVVVIYNGLDVQSWMESPDSRLRASLSLGKGPVIGVVANFIHYKGHTIFFEAWSDVLQKYPHAVALLVGDGVLRTEVETKAAQMGLMPSLRFLGVRDDVPKLLALVDIYVHPSLQEGHSNAILEAMAAAKPVVACAVGGNVETVTAGQTGLLVPPGDSRALAEAIIRLLDNPDEATRFGAAARRVVAERFDERTMAARYEEVYERLVAEKTEGRVRVSVPIPFPPSTQTAATIEGRSGHVRDRGQD